VAIVHPIIRGLPLGLEAIELAPVNRLRHVPGKLRGYVSFKHGEIKLPSDFLAK
jgi:hypothetical protein